jgi:hypothetical protein
VPGGRPWYGQWWAIAGLVLLLVVGSVAGYGATRAVLTGSEADPPPVAGATTDPSGGGGATDPAGAPPPAPTPPPAAGAPGEPTPDSPGLPELPDLPDLPDLPTGLPIPDGVGGVCEQVALIMLTMALAPLEAEGREFDDYLEVVADSYRTAAEQIRALDGADAAQRAALDTFADEVDAAARQLADNPTDETVVETAFLRVTGAYDAFNRASCA